MKALSKIPRLIRGAFFHILQWTWCLPQNLLGALALLFFRGSRSRYHGAFVTVYRVRPGARSLGGFSLGSFIFMPETWPAVDLERIVVHEYGHTVQSLFLGPFYLFVVGLPSVLWSRRFMRRRSVYRARGVEYTDRFPENSASSLGERVTGEKSV